MDPVTALLRTRPESVRAVLKAFGWTFNGRLGWCSSIWLGNQSRVAILDLRTLAWRVGPEGKRDTLRGWLAGSFCWFFKGRGTPREWWPQETARIVQGVTGPWPELQTECERQRAALVGCTAWAPEGRPTRNPEPGSGFSTEAKMAEAAGVSDRTIIRQPKPEAASGLKTEATKGEAASPLATAKEAARPLLECHGWPYDPDQAPNVVTFLRPWRGPRGGNGGAA